MAVPAVPRNVEPLLRPVPVLHRQHLHTTDQPRLLHQPCEFTQNKQARTSTELKKTIPSDILRLPVSPSAFVLLFLPGPPVIFPLRGSCDGPRSFSWSLHQRELHAALLQTAARQTHPAQRPGDHRPRVAQESRLDTVSISTSTLVKSM